KIMADVLAKEFRFIWEQNGDMPDTRWHDLFEPSPEFVELELRGLRGWLTKVLWRSPFAGPDRLHALGGLPGDRWAAHEELLGVHFRQTDNTHFYEGAIPPAAYHAHMDCVIERFPNARFFVAADTVQARDVTRRRYGERILTHVTESPDVDPRLGDRYARLGQQAALADLIALSRTSIIIG